MDYVVAITVVGRLVAALAKAGRDQVWLVGGAHHQAFAQWLDILPPAIAGDIQTFFKKDPETGFFPQLDEIILRDFQTNGITALDSNGAFLTIKLTLQDAQTYFARFPTDRGWYDKAVSFFQPVPTE